MVGANAFLKPWVSLCKAIQKTKQEEIPHCEAHLNSDGWEHPLSSFLILPLTPVPKESCMALPNERPGKSGSLGTPGSGLTVFLLEVLRERKLCLKAEKAPSSGNPSSCSSLLQIGCSYQGLPLHLSILKPWTSHLTFLAHYLCLWKQCIVGIFGFFFLITFLCVYFDQNWLTCFPEVLHRFFMMLNNNTLHACVISQILSHV